MYTYEYFLHILGLIIQMTKLLWDILWYQSHMDKPFCPHCFSSHQRDKIKKTDETTSAIPNCLGCFIPTEHTYVHETSLPISNVANFIFNKLDGSSYLLRSRQFQPILINRDLVGDVDGTIKAPPTFNDDKTPNSPFHLWQKTTILFGVASMLP